MKARRPYRWRRYSRPDAKGDYRKCNAIENLTACRHENGRAAMALTTGLIVTIGLTRRTAARRRWRTIASVGREAKRMRANDAKEIALGDIDRYRWVRRAKNNSHTQREDAEKQAAAAPSARLNHPECLRNTAWSNRPRHTSERMSPRADANTTIIYRCVSNHCIHWSR